MPANPEKAEKSAPKSEKSTPEKVEKSAPAEKKKKSDPAALKTATQTAVTSAVENAQKWYDETGGADARRVLNCLKDSQKTL